MSANDSVRMSACGCRAAAIAAVTGSTSIPVTSAESGANAMKFPLPHPGSRTRPPVNPSAVTPSQIAWATAASV